MTQRVDRFLCWYGILAGVASVVALAFVVGLVSNTSTAIAQADAPPELEQRRSSPQTSLDEVAPTVMCPSCGTTIDQTNSPAAERVRAYVRAGVDAGWTADEIRDGLVEEYNGDESVLAAPRVQGIGLVAWLVPALVAVAALAVGAVSLRRWRRNRATRAVSEPA